MTNQKNNESGCLYYALISFFGGSGIFLIWLSLSTIYQTIAVYGWIPMEAKIEKLEINPTALSGKHKKSIINKVNVSYRYSINSTAFQGHLISPYDEKLITSLTNYPCIYEKLSNADQIKIFYNPKNFNQSVIARGLDNSMVILLLSAILWNSILVLMLRAKNAKRFSFERIIRIEMLIFYLSLMFIVLIVTKTIYVNDLCQNIEVLNGKINQN